MRPAFRCCRSSAPPPNAPPGATVRAGSAPPIWRCTSCCRSSMAACSPASSPSRIRCRRRRGLPSPRWRAARSRIASRWSRTASQRWCACARCRASERRVAILLPDYPGAKGRTGYAVGLDVPASVIAAIDRPCGRRLHDRNAPKTPRDLLDALDAAVPRGDALLKQYEDLLARLPDTALRAACARRGANRQTIPMCATALSVFARKNSAIFWWRCRPIAAAPRERRADYHDPLLPPRHALVAFGLWLQHVAKADALVHMGAHGTLEWLPGKAVALTADCFPEIVTGRLPVIYPFIVSNPGEAAQAKRRIAGVTIGHLPPPLVAGGPAGEAHELELLLDEYAQADGLDRRRRERLATLIVETAQRTGLASEAGITAGGGSAMRPTKRCGASTPGCAISRTSPSRTASTFTAGRRRASTTRHGSAAAKPSAQRSSRHSTDAVSHRDPLDRRRADGAMCCRPDAIFSPPIRARCRHQPRWSSAGSPPTKWCARICRRTARCRARWSSISGEARHCAPAARRSRRDWRSWAAGRSGTTPPAASPGSKCCRPPRSDARASMSPGAFPDCFAISFQRKSRSSTPRYRPSPRAMRMTTTIRLQRRGAQ